MGFLRKQEEQMALRLLKWHYSNSDQPQLSEDQLRRKAIEVVNEAHVIAKKRGQNVWSILKEMFKDIKKG